MRRKRKRRILKKRHQGLFMSLKLAIIGYLVIFSVSYMSTGTSAYLSSQAVVSDMIIAGVWGCSEETEDDRLVGGEHTFSGGSYPHSFIPVISPVAPTGEEIIDGEEQPDIPQVEIDGDALSGEETTVNEEAQVDLPIVEINNDASAGEELAVNEEAQVDISDSVSDEGSIVDGEMDTQADEASSGGETTSSDDVQTDTSSEETSDDAFVDDETTADEDISLDETDNEIVDEEETNIGDQEQSVSSPVEIIDLIGGNATDADCLELEGDLSGVGAGTIGADSNSVCGDANVKVNVEIENINPDISADIGEEINADCGASGVHPPEGTEDDGEAATDPDNPDLSESTNEDNAVKEETDTDLNEQEEGEDTDGNETESDEEGTAQEPTIDPEIPAEKKDAVVDEDLTTEQKIKKAEGNLNENEENNEVD